MNINYFYSLYTFFFNAIRFQMSTLYSFVFKYKLLAATSINIDIGDLIVGKLQNLEFLCQKHLCSRYKLI